MNISHLIGKFAAPEAVSAEKIYDWLKSDEVEVSMHYDNGNPMMVGQHMRMRVGNKLYVLEIVEAEWRPVGSDDDTSAADLTLKVMTVEDVID